MRHLLENTSQRAIQYLEGLDSRRVSPDADAIANLSQFDGELPEHSGDPFGYPENAG